MKAAWHCTGSIALLLVLASLVQATDAANQFLVAPTYPVGRRPSSIALADFNRDNIQDLAVFNNYDRSGYGGPPSISVLLGNGDGSFRTSQTIVFSSAPRINR